jgi:ACS family glucarate transporter-like MFS transporter
MTSCERRSERAHRVLLGFAMLLAAILYMDRVCIAQSQYLISEELGLSKQQMGLAFTVFGIAYGLFEIPGGWLADRFGPRRVLTSGVCWWSFFTVASGWAQGLASLVGYRFLFGLGQACCFPNLTRAFSNWFRGEDRTRAQSLMWLAARWGGAFTPLLVVLVLDLATWRQSFFVFGSVGFLWALLFWRWFRDQPKDYRPAESAGRVVEAGPCARPGQPQGAAPTVPWKRLFASCSVWLLCLQYACLSYGFWFYLTWLPTYVREQFGLEQADRYVAALLAAPPLFLAGIGCVLAGWLTPRLARRFGDVRRVRRGLGVFGHAMACVLLLVSIGCENPILSMIAMGFSCFGNDIAMPGSWAACMDMGGRFSGTLSGTMNMWGCIGGLLAPWTIPYILEAADGQWRTVILVIAGWYAVGALCWLGIDPVTPVTAPERKDQDELPISGIPATET